MKEHWVFLSLIVPMIAIGEETGALDEMLAKVADFYEDDVEQVIDRLKSLIEPFVIVLLAGIVRIKVVFVVILMFDF